MDEITAADGSHRLNNLAYDAHATACFRQYVESVNLIKRGELYRKLVIDIEGKIVKIVHISQAYSARLLSGNINENIWEGIVPSVDDEDQFQSSPQVKDFVTELCSKSHEQYEMCTCPYKRIRVNHRSEKPADVHASFIPLSLKDNGELSHFIVAEVVDFSSS